MKRPNLKLKMPNLGKLDSKPGIKPPKLVADLYADLRDRRLLPLVALLLVGIFAAPFLLGGNGEEETPPPPAPPAVGETATASFSVVPADPGLREIDKRLGHRHARDPFRVPKDNRQPSGGGSAAAGEPQTEEPAGGSEAPPVVKQTTNIVVQSDVTEFGVEIVAGFVGSPEKELPHVREMTPLPNKQNPVVTFIGLNAERSGAIFLMSSDVTAYFGKGVCVDDKQACQMLELKPGKSATFAVGFGETRYKLRLKQIVAKVKTYTKDMGSVSGE